MSFALRPKKKVAVFCTPHSGRNTKLHGLGQIIAGILSTPANTFNTATFEELKLAVRQLHFSRGDVAVIVGGDGSIRLNLDKILKEYARTPERALPHFVIVSGGNQNVIPQNLGLGTALEEAVDFAKLIAYKNERNLPFDTVHLNPLKVNDDHVFIYGTALPASCVAQYFGRASFRCVNVTHFDGVSAKVEKPSCGFSCRWDKAARFGGVCPRCGNPLERILGRSRFVQVMLEAFWDETKAKLLFRQSRKLLTNPVYARIALPAGHEKPFAPFMEYTGIMCSTVESIGNGCRAMPYARKLPNHFMLRCTNLGFWGLASNLPLLWSGLPLPAKSVFDAVVPYLTIKYERPTVRQYDGDLIETPTLVDHIEIGPLLTVIVG